MWKLRVCTPKIWITIFFFQKKSASFLRNTFFEINFQKIKTHQNKKEFFCSEKYHQLCTSMFWEKKYNNICKSPSKINVLFDCLHSEGNFFLSFWAFFFAFKLRHRFRHPSGRLGRRKIESGDSNFWISWRERKAPFARYPSLSNTHTHTHTIGRGHLRGWVVCLQVPAHLATPAFRPVQFLHLLVELPVQAVEIGIGLIWTATGGGGNLGGCWWGGGWVLPS